jgi:hypothetical protein
MPDLLQQRKADLERQFLAIPEEMKLWKEASAEGKPYEKHHSQIGALSKQMCELNARIESEWTNGPEPYSFEGLWRARLRCAAIQTVWNYFREKLVLREHPDYGRYLKAADAYTWACYEPVLKQARKANPGQPFREPPLVAFHSEISPWALSRQSRYETERDPTGMAGNDDNSPFEQVRRALPIPIVATPWQNLLFLPNLALLAHETGHIVESDFALAKAVEQAIAEAIKDQNHTEGWSKFWRAEVFADWFGCVAAGPSFVWALVDSIPDSPAAAATKVRPANMLVSDPAKRWGKYPPPSLRVGFNTKALKKLGFEIEADHIAEYWEKAYAQNPMHEWSKDLGPLVDALDTVDLPVSLKFSLQEEPMQRAYEDIRAGATSLNPQTPIDPRALIGAASLFHRGTTGGAASRVDSAMACRRLQDHIVDSRPPGVLAEQQERAAEFLTRTEELHYLLFEHFDEE